MFSRPELQALALNFSAPSFAHVLKLFSCEINSHMSTETAVASRKLSSRETATGEYLQTHQLQSLFSHLLQLVVYHQPENPRAFLVDELKRLQERKETLFFTDDELDMMFNLVDVTNQGFITLKQLRHAYANLSLSSRSHGRAANHNSSVGQLQDHQVPPEVLSTGQVSQQQFKQVLGALLQTNNIWA